MTYGGLRGRSAQNLRWGTGRTAHASVPPICGEVAFVRCARKHEESKKGVIKELFSEIGFFSGEERVVYDITQITVDD